MLLPMRAIFCASSPILSRSVTVLVMAKISRRSFAAGWRLTITCLQSLDRAPDLRFDQAAHLEHARADRLELGVELLGKMLADRHPGCHYDKTRSRLLPFDDG